MKNKLILEEIWSSIKDSNTVNKLAIDEDGSWYITNSLTDALDKVITEQIHSNENNGTKIVVWWIDLWLMIAPCEWLAAIVVRLYLKCRTW